MQRNRGAIPIRFNCLQSFKCVYMGRTLVVIPAQAGIH